MRILFIFLTFSIMLTSCQSAATVVQQMPPTLSPAPAASPTPQSSPSPTVKLDPSPTITPSPFPTTRPTPTDRPVTQADEYAFEQNRRLGRGVNLGNALEAPKEGEWGVTLKESYFQQIKDGGFNSIRVPIRWNAHALETAPYTIDPEFFKRIDWVVEQAVSRDLVVILNIHHYEEMTGDFAGHKQRFLAIWDQIAQHYQQAPDSVYFELLNEPHGRLSKTLAWNEIAAETIAVIRKTNPNRTLVIGPGEYNSIASLDDLVLPEEDRNIIVTFHYYDPFYFTHQGAEWVTDSNKWLGSKWLGTVPDQISITRYIDIAVRWGKQYARPLYMGEFGAYSKADSESRNRWTAFVARSAEERGISWAYWEFCAGFGVYDPVAGDWVDPIYTALIP